MPRNKVEEITISAKAPSIEAVFSKMGLEMFNIVIDTKNVDLSVTKTVIIRARDLKNMLFQFLRRLYDLANNDLFVISAVKQITLEKVSNEYLLNAVLIGDKMNPKYNVKDIVKQVTDRNIIIKEDRQGVAAQINIVVERRNIQEDEV